MDARSDFYAPGVMFYEMPTDKVPFDVQESFAVAYAHINDSVPQLPAALEVCQTLIDGLMAKDPEQRPRSADVLERLLKGDGRVEEEMSAVGLKAETQGAAVAPTVVMGVAGTAKGDLIIKGCGSTCSRRCAPLQRSVASEELAVYGNQRSRQCRSKQTQGRNSPEDGQRGLALQQDEQ